METKYTVKMIDGSTLTTDNHSVTRNGGFITITAIVNGTESQVTINTAAIAYVVKR